MRWYTFGRRRFSRRLHWILFALRPGANCPEDASKITNRSNHASIRQCPSFSSTGNIHVLTNIPHDRDTRTSILTVAETILTEEAEHVDAAAPVALGYGDVSAPMSLGLNFLGQQLPRGPDGEFEC
jgi:hypothetical protein